MIANSCQLGVLFGGKRFILFLMLDQVRNGQIIHQMQCSPILDTSPGGGSPGLIQVTIAALLGSKDAFFKATNIRAGLTVVREEPESKGKKIRKQPFRKAAKKRSSSSQTGQKRKKRTGTARATQEIPADLSVS